MPVHTTNELIDISSIARPFRLVRLANYFMVVGCGTWLVGQLFNAASVTADWLPYLVPFWIALALNFWAGLKTAGAIDAKLWPRLYWSLTLLALTAGLASISLYRSLPADVEAHTNPAGNAQFVALVLSAAMALSGLAALLAVRVLARSRIAALSLSFRDLIAAVEASAVAPAPAVRARPVGPVRGTFYLTLAAALLIAPHFVPDAIWQPNAQVLSLLSLSGWAFLFHGRRYFQPSAESLRAVDRRPPVVLLRSFEDDERHRYLRSELSVIDFGLETRLAAHFLLRFGPFVAIGSPRDPTPRPGAATAHLSDDEWQSAVLRWIKQAKYIVLLAGTTHWVNWELTQVVRGGQAGKLILMLPRLGGWLPWRRRQAAVDRLAKITEVFRTTGATTIPIEGPRPEDIRAIVLRADGTFSIVTSRPRNRDSYHVAAIIAQYLLMRRSSPEAS